MEKIISIDSVKTYNTMRGVETTHPLVNVLDLSKTKPITVQTFNYGVYAIFLKELKCGELKYGRNTYDFQEGSLVFISPGQIMKVEPNVTTYAPKGWGLFFHPDLLLGTQLGKDIKKYSFFSYDSNEALHLSDKEKQMVLECFKNIQYEIEQPIDKHSNTLITTNIELLLNYSSRFFDRQFDTRKDINKGILEKFEKLLYNYFSSDNSKNLGLPSVAYCASQLNLSSNYFGDLVKKETGKSAQEYIQEKVIYLAKEKILDLNKNISEIAYELGFKYPQHFTRFFKNQLGITPNEYRNIN